ncbi:MAG: hypothetical protein K2O12_02275 [Muribaculaceae bacterium]|nr:hypothetical protein [Muribaculaceae bacterium]
MTNASDSGRQQLMTQLMQLLSRPDMAVEPQWVEQMKEQFPCFALPQMLQLQRDTAMSEADRAHMLERLALSVTDKESFLETIDMTAAERSRFYPEESHAPKMTTDGVIDTFLRHYGTSSPEEDALLEKLIFNPVAEYAGVLEAENDARPEPVDEQDRMIDAFLASASHADGEPPVSESEEESQEPASVSEEERTAEISSRPGLLSESLAIIFIKQRRYAKAYEILLNLSLNYPEKSIYFADQLRFLQKLIINQSYKQKEQT